MQFILNTSFLPHFCALFDRDNRLLKKIEWTDFREGGRIIWDFLEREKIYEKKIAFLGGITGPGGFSNLRSGGAILNALGFFYQLPIHQARADAVAQELLGSLIPKPHILLNSFGKNFFRESSGVLIRENIENLPDFLQIDICFAEFLPPEKKEKIPKKLEIFIENIEIPTLAVLQKSLAQKNFVPDYEYPAVP